MSEYYNSVDEVLTEACEYEEDIELGYFTENLKYLLDKDIDNYIEDSLYSIFNSESDATLPSVLVDMVNQLETEIRASDCEMAKRDIQEPDETEIIRHECDLDNITPEDFRIGRYNWVDDDDDTGGCFFRNDTGEYNPGYDSIFNA